MFASFFPLTPEQLCSDLSSARGAARLCVCVYLTKDGGLCLLGSVPQGDWWGGGMGGRGEATLEGPSAGSGEEGRVAH